MSQPNPLNLQSIVNSENKACDLTEYIQKYADLIFCEVLVRKPVLSPVPDVLPWNDILAASPALVKRSETPESAYCSPDGSILVDVRPDHRIYVELEKKGGRQIRKQLKRRSLRLLELMLMDYYGIPCRVRFTAKERVYVAQFGK